MHMQMHCSSFLLLYIYATKYLSNVIETHYALCCHKLCYQLMTNQSSLENCKTTNSQNFKSSGPSPVAAWFLLWYMHQISLRNPAYIYRL